MTRRQLTDAGLSSAAIARRIEGARLHRLHRGVYALGHLALSSEGRCIAAVLACGEGAAVSHRSAARLWGLLPATGGAIDVSIQRTSGCKRRAGIRLHRCPSLGRECLTRRNGIPVTTPARTISDLRPEASAAELRRAIRQAEVLGLPTGLEPRAQSTRSELEDLFLALCRRYRVPEPAVNARLGSRVVDFLWAGQRVVVETDGYRYHRGATAFEDDHARDLELRLLGYQVIRFTYRQVTERPERIARALREALGCR